MNNLTTQLSAIKKTLGKSKNDYSCLDKCNAILNWADKADIGFNTDFVTSIRDYALVSMPSYNQEKAINNIIDRFEINIAKWVI